jgi:hypothetical protein
MTNKYPKDIMQIMRRSLLLNDDDTSKDAKINKMQYKKVFKEVLISKYLLMVQGINENVIDEMIFDVKRIYDRNYQYKFKENAIQ